MAAFIEVYPKRAFTFVESKPDEDIYEIRVTLKDVPGALAKAASLVAEAGINMKTSIVFSTLSEEKQGFWTTFIDVSKSKMQIDELIKKLNLMLLWVLKLSNLNQQHTTSCTFQCCMERKEPS